MIYIHFFIYFVIIGFMKRLLVIVIFLFCFSSVSAIDKQSIDLNIEAESIILIDAKSKTILYEKNSSNRYNILGLQNLMTLILSKENIDDNTYISASSEAIFGFDRDKYTHIFLTQDENIKAIDLEYAAYLANSTEANRILAEHISGSEDDFVLLMNKKKDELGLVDTNFTSSYGKIDDSNYSNAKDLALLSAYVLNNSSLKDLYNSKYYKMEATNKQSVQREFTTSNKLLLDGSYKNESVIGGKVSYDKDFGYNASIFASSNNLDLIVVVLNSKNEASLYSDINKVLDYGFANYKNYIIKGKNIERKEVSINKNGRVVGDASFYLEDDINILLDSYKEEKNIRTEIEVKDESDIENINAYLVIYIDDQKVGEVLLKKDINVYDISFKGHTLPIIGRIFDYISVGVLALFVAVGFVKLTMKK